ncbi:hypothetical protein TIFTF001_008067 [Ficus carica]|uniref:Uncharacterized protein n=1 Tax=Ficus carica TaxID=3494 RepID=A0AA87ZSP2_FICCA|nr:hypothetical protein TIFTF001_008067 [Ficus carica]
MASSSCSFKTLFLVMTTILVIAMFSGPCSAARLGKMAVAMKAETEAKTTSAPQNYKLLPQTGFLFRGQTFNFFPKGNPVPPSGPSKRHNSSPQN